MIGTRQRQNALGRFAKHKRPEGFCCNVCTYCKSIMQAGTFYVHMYIHMYIHMRCACYNTYMYKNTILLNTLYVFKNGFCICLPVRLTSTDSYAALCSILGLRRRQKRRRPKKPVPPQLPPLKNSRKKLHAQLLQRGKKKRKKTSSPAFPRPALAKRYALVPRQGHMQYAA